MAANRYRPHVLFICEDEAYKQLYNGLQLEMPPRCGNRVLYKIAHGWLRARDYLLKVAMTELYDFPEMRVVVLIDFDGDEGRCAQILQRFPSH